MVVESIRAISAAIATPATTDPLGPKPGVALDVSVRDIYVGTLPFWVEMMICLVILVAFPQIALILPNTMLN